MLRTLKNIVIWSFFLLVYGYSQDINLKGKVVDKDYNPLNKVVVKLWIADHSDTTDVNGEFNIIVKSTGNLPHSIRETLEFPVIKGNILSFESLSERNVSLDVIDIRGHIVKNIYKGPSKKGINSVSITLNGFKHGIYIIKSNMGGKVFFNKYSHMGKASMKEIKPNGLGTLSKHSAIIDTLVITKGGYGTRKLDISNYSHTFGEIVLMTQNSSPSFLSTPDDMTSSGTVGTQYIDTVHVVDPDDDDFELRLIVKPDNMLISDNIITWTPNEDQIGDNSVSVLANNGNDGGELLSWKIAVVDSNSQNDLVGKWLTKTPILKSDDDLYVEYIFYDDFKIVAKVTDYDWDGTNWIIDYTNQSDGIGDYYSFYDYNNSYVLFHFEENSLSYQQYYHYKITNDSLILKKSEILSGNSNSVFGHWKNIITDNSKVTTERRDVLDITILADSTLKNNVTQEIFPLEIHDDFFTVLEYGSYRKYSYEIINNKLYLILEFEGDIRLRKEL
jgi:hypothetical protein